ncbi:hypothetical protein XENORESO_006193 [Xenotaenia resolanae]|uniref:Uncharacterized protein n=1 Tax=Xenotaenia resolanae TaxID=208358 RepID=A0ABV0WHW8_9TELE
MHMAHFKDALYEPAGREAVEACLVLQGFTDMSVTFAKELSRLCSFLPCAAHDELPDGKMLLLENEHQMDLFVCSPSSSKASATMCNSRKLSSPCVLLLITLPEKKRREEVEVERKQEWRNKE